MRNFWCIARISLTASIFNHYDSEGYFFRLLSMYCFKLFHYKEALSDLRKILAAENPLIVMKNAFYFILAALFVLKIFKFLSGILGHVQKRLD